jgi:acetyl-CoA/propionyl-CoA carboxylase biotin carboxyl carrier protein
VRDGDEVAEGATLLTIEAMKMQNEVRAPRAGRVSGVAVAVGRKVVAGASLLRIE